MKTTILNICFSLLVVITYSCHSPDKKPQGLLTEKEMEAIMPDVMLADAKLQIIALPPDSVRAYAKKYYKQVCDKYHTTPEILYNSLRYYSRSPKEFNKIMQPVTDSLNAIDARIK